MVVKGRSLLKGYPATVIREDAVLLRLSRANVRGGLEDPS